RYLAAAWEYGQKPAGPKHTIEAFATGRGLHAFALRRWVEYLKGPRLGSQQRLTIPVKEYDGEPGIHAWTAKAERPWWGANTTSREVAIETFVLPPRSVTINPGDAGGAVGWTSPVAGVVRVAGRLIDCDPHDGSGVRWIVDLVTPGGRH